MPVTKRLSPARSRAADQTVKRATLGLMRLDSRRRCRSGMRWLCYLALVLAPLATIIFWYSQELAESLTTAWETILTKLTVEAEESLPRR
jgi:hypothetical protein